MEQWNTQLYILLLICNFLPQVILEVKVEMKEPSGVESTDKDIIFIEGRPNTKTTIDAAQVNVTVTVNQRAILPCSINNKSNRMSVMWEGPDGKVLAINNERTIDDVRISIVRPYIRDWNLHIDRVRATDQGEYRCSVGPFDPITKIINLYVKVPAKIVNGSKDITTQEGNTATLFCLATGVPPPIVSWYKRKANQPESKKEKMIGRNGEILVLHNVTRYCDNYYQCEAYNGVKQAVSRTMRVTVEFPPEVRLPNQEIKQFAGRDTILECMIEAYPLASTYWMFRNKEITRSTKYSLDIYDDSTEKGNNMATLTMRIFDLNEDDFGEYTCVAKNSLGIAKKTMRLTKYDSPKAKPNFPEPKDEIEREPKDEAKPTIDEQVNARVDPSPAETSVSVPGSSLTANGEGESKPPRSSEANGGTKPPLNIPAKQPQAPTQSSGKPVAKETKSSGHLSSSSSQTILLLTITTTLVHLWQK